MLLQFSTRYRPWISRPIPKNDNNTKHHGETAVALTEFFVRIMRTFFMHSNTPPRLRSNFFHLTTACFVWVSQAQAIEGTRRRRQLDLPEAAEDLDKPGVTLDTVVIDTPGNHAHPWAARNTPERGRAEWALGCVVLFGLSSFLRRHYDNANLVYTDLHYAQ